MIEYSRRLSLGSEVSFVLCPTDDFKGKTASLDSYKICFPYNPRAIVYKQNGYIIFRGLPQGEHYAEIHSETYFDEKFNFCVSPLVNEPPVEYISLKPRPSYPFKAGTTLLRLNVTGEKGNPISNVLIKAKFLSSECQRGRIAKGPIKKGDIDFYLSAVTGRIFAGEQYSVGVGSEQEETFIISEQLEGLRHFRTKHPFMNEHDRGSIIMPTVYTQTDERGEAVVYFKSLNAKKFNISITLEYSDKNFTSEVSIEEGKTINLGKISLHDFGIL